MNTDELEDAIRAELRAEVRQAPAGAPTKAAVLQAVAELPMDQASVRCAGGRCRCSRRPRWCWWRSG